MDATPDSLTRQVRLAASVAADAASTCPPRSLNALAEAAMGLGLAAEADAAWQAMLRHRPDHAGALRGRIEAALALGDLAAARQMAAAAAPRLGGTDPFEMLRARVLVEGGETDAAIAALEAAIANGSAGPPVHLRLSGLLERRGDAAAADTVLAGLLAVRPDMLEAHRKRANLALSDQDDAQLLAVSAAGLARFPDDPLLRERHAQAQLRLGHRDAARAELEAALALKPDHIGCRMHLARMLAADGRDDEADAVLAEALRRAPEHRGAALLRIDLAEARGDRDGATAQARAAIHGTS